MSEKTAGPCSIVGWAREKDCYPENRSKNSPLAKICSWISDRTQIQLQANQTCFFHPMVIQMPPTELQGTLKLKFFRASSNRGYTCNVGQQAFVTKSWKWRNLPIPEDTHENSVQLSSLSIFLRIGSKSARFRRGRAGDIGCHSETSGHIENNDQHMYPAGNEAKCHFKVRGNWF